MPELTESEKAIFRVAVSLTDAGQRQQFLQQACGSNELLLQQLERLLAADEAADRFVSSPVRQSDVTGDNGLFDKQSEQIGRYKLLQKIGEGGFGVVYMAEQQEPVVRKLALKIIKPGMDTKQVIARFEAERQALAMMEHPNIAKVLDAGETDNGRPYFVMELVRGVSIVDYCDQQKLTNHRRLRLFLDVCGAIQHAHQKGIIHRDLKPSNILVTLHDGQPVPKVIDFGIAKATQQRLTDKTLFTRFEQFIGTPAYMSPEQTQMSGMDIDTRSDIYSLGVLLYELLTGQTPFQRKELSEAGFDEMRRCIREDDPPTPSSRLSGIERAALTQVAENRQEDPRNVSGLLRGDLDWIVMKAMEKQPARRYDAALDLARDVRCYLTDQPVEACPPSIAYQLRKFVRRNYRAVITAAVLLFVVCLGLLGTTIGMVRARKEAQRVQTSLYEAEMAAAYEAWNSGDLKRVEDALRRQIPKSGQKDLRGFEWYYLTDRCMENAADSFTFNEPIAHVTMDERSEILFALLRNDNIVEIDLANRRKKVHRSSFQQGFAPNCLAVSDDGAMLAIGGSKSDGSGKIEVRHLSGEGRYELTSETQIRAIGFSDDGKWAASYDLKGMVQLWNAMTGELQWKEMFIRGNFEPALEFSPDGRMLVTAETVDGHVAFWEVSTGEQQGYIENLGSLLRDIEFSPDGSKIVIVGKHLHVLNAATLQPDDTIHRRYLGFAHSVSFSPDGNRFAVGNQGNTVMILDFATSEVLETTLHRELVMFVKYSLDGKSLLSASRNVVRIKNLNKVAMSQEMGTTWGTTFAVDSESNRIAFPGRGPNKEVLLWDLDRAKPDRLAGHQARVSSVAFSYDGKLLASGDASGTIRIWDTASYEQTSEFKITRKDGQVDYVVSLACSPVSNLLVAAGQHASMSTVSAWDMKTGQELWPGITPKTGAIVFTSDGRMVTGGGVGTWSDPGHLTVWNVDGTPQELEQIPHDRFVDLLAFWHSPETGEMYLAASDRSPQITIYDAKGKRLRQHVGPLLGHTIAVTSLDFDPSGKTLVSSSWDGTLRMWSVASGRQVGIIRERDEVQEIKFLAPTSRIHPFLTKIQGRNFTIREVNILDPDVSWMRPRN